MSKSCGNCSKSCGNLKHATIWNCSKSCGKWFWVLSHSLYQHIGTISFSLNICKCPWYVIHLSFVKEVTLLTYIVIVISGFWDSTIAGCILLGSQQWLCSGMLEKLLQWIDSSKVHIILPTLLCYNWPCWWLHNAVISLRFLPIGVLWILLNWNIV